MTYPVALGAVGIVKEASYGAGGVAAMLLPCTAVGTPADVVGQLVDRSWRGSAVDSVNHVPGTTDGAVSLGGNVTPDTIGFPLVGILGDVAVASGTTKTHTISVLNSGAQQPPSYAVTISDPIGPLLYAGCKFTAVKLDFTPDGLLTWAADLVGFDAAAGSALPVTASAEKVIAGWVGVVTIGGTVETRVMAASVEFTRPVTAKRNVTGVQRPWLQRSEMVKVAGSMTLVASTDSYRQLALLGTSTSLDINYSQGAGAALRQLKVHCSDVTLISAPRDYGQQWIELAVTFETDANATDAGVSGGLSPVKVTLQNQIAAGVYA